MKKQGFEVRRVRKQPTGGININVPDEYAKQLKWIGEEWVKITLNVDQMTGRKWLIMEEIKDE